MRIVIDMQGAQTESRFRGIGRYSLSLALAMARRAAGRHEVLLALNGLLPDAIDAIREAFSGILPRESIRVWDAIGPTRELDPANASRREIAERIREAFLLSLKPDVVLVTSMFEGLGDDAVVSIGKFDSATPTAVILYDLIPLLNPDIHFRNSTLRQEHYGRKIEYIQRSRQLLAISDSARAEALRGLSFAPESVTNVSGACDEFFKKIEVRVEEQEAIRKKFDISGDIVMYTGGADERKNLARLVAAYAQLPSAVRETHRLVMAGRMPEGEVSALRAQGSKAGLVPHELVFTGYISDDELLALYNMCKLFVFPSTHEGFGIPPLEAMSCGAAVIGASSTSLPEVLGSSAAMFDPESIESISDKMRQALTDEEFRAELLRNASVQVSAFSWDISARRALAALEKFDTYSSGANARPTRVEKTTIFESRSRRILLLKLDHLGDLFLAMPAIAKLRARYPEAKLEIAVGRWNAELANMFPFFDKVHVLDYFKKQSASQASVAQEELANFFSQLGTYDIALDLRRQGDTRFILRGVNAATKVGYRSFDASVDDMLDIALDSVPDVPFVETSMNSTSISKQMLALVDALPADPNDYIQLPRLFEGVIRRLGAVALFPYAGNDVKEWEIEKFQALVARLCMEDKVQEINLFFASDAEASRHAFADSVKVRTQAGLGIAALMEAVAQNSICIANNSGGAHLASYLGLTVIGVYGGHETAKEWAPVFPGSYVIHRGAHCSPCHIAHRRDCNFELYCLADISVDEVFSMVSQALNSEEISTTSTATPKTITNDLATVLAPYVAEQTDEQIVAIARCIASSIRLGKTGKRIFVDVSELVQGDSRTGIQRVTRSILMELLDSPPSDFEILPVYATTTSDGYFVARGFLKSFTANSRLADAPDEALDFYAGDIFLGLDLQPHVTFAQKTTLDAMHRAGVKVVFVVYDLLCVQMPQHFVEGSSQGFSKWLDSISAYDGALCISRSVAADLSQYMKRVHPERARHFEIDWFHIGADIESSSPTTGLPSTAARTLRTLAMRPSFLAVGTVEPRKGHTQMLDAFEHLWRRGVDVNLVVVGKQGWLVDQIAERLRKHAETGSRLFWLENISDEYLERVYDASTCLIAPSEGEGFGLPLIEAARHRIPIIARDLVVFEEVAGQNAYYFHGMTSGALADAIQVWLKLFDDQAHPKSDSMPWLTWRQATQKLLEVVSRSSVASPEPAQASGPVVFVRSKPIEELSHE